jgi:hypothetical protein
VVLPTGGPSDLSDGLRELCAIAVRISSSLLPSWAKRYVYFWADGIHVQARPKDDAQCLLVIIGVRAATFWSP